MTKKPLKPGEKILFAVFGVFFALALAGYVVLEVVRSQMDEPMFTSRTSFNLSAAGQRGSKLFREANCTACHRAMRNGTNHGVILDGAGSRRSLAWLEAFLRQPEANYPGATIDHGLPPKEAAYVAQLPPQDLHDIAVFLSELKAEQGSAMAAKPPEGSEGLARRLANTWAPQAWKDKYPERQTPQEQAPPHE
ncbi:MAG: c-type cytochrome [Gammaproteobacteria bacterium]